VFADIFTSSFCPYPVQGPHKFPIWLMQIAHHDDTVSEEKSAAVES
jgi:hypothetical protein